MIYIFCDEAISCDNSDYLYLYSAVTFSQRKYNNSGFRRIQELRQGKSSLLGQIVAMIKATDGYGLLSHAQIPTNLLPAEKLSTNDIEKMSTKDFTWSLSMMFTIAHLIRKLLEQKWNFKTVDVYYDTKSLNEKHRCAIEKYMQEKLKTHIMNFLRGSNSEKVNVRRVRAVRKAKSGSTPDKFQLGTWLADRIVRRYRQIANLEEGSPFELVDLTQDISETLNDFFRRESPVREDGTDTP